MDTSFLESVREIPFEDPRLGRHVVHDVRSRDHREDIPRRALVLRNVQHRRYDPRPDPNQEIGCCTFVSECMLANTVNNRIRGKVLNMADAVAGYSLATALDPFEGTYPPNDTGSSGLAAAQAAVQLGIGEEYVWYFGLQEILYALQFHPISFGGVWTYDMFKATKSNPVIRPTGEVAGGHQWVLSGFRTIDRVQYIVGECWWGSGFGDNGRFYISVPDFQTLVDQEGDAHFTKRKQTNE